MQISVEYDLWEYLSKSQKHVVMYGMGNGADKILRVCESRGIEIADFFASDGFVRGHHFHGKPVLSWSAIKEKYGAEHVIVLLSFGTSRPEVLENVKRIASEAELYAPDVPVFGEGLFDRAYFLAHREELAQVEELLSDEESVRIFEDVLRYKLTGRIEPLLRATSDEEEVLRTQVRPHEIRVAADFGAYNGDTVRQLLDHGEGKIERIYAFEPDRRNFQKLLSYAKEEKRAEVLPVEAGAWNEDTTLCFDASGNRNASFESSRSSTLADRPAKLRVISARRPDSILQGVHVDYMKYDVEGAEKEALEGSEGIIRASSPRLLVSLYHRNEDLFALPLLIKARYPQYKRFYLRRFGGVPAWDINLYCDKA